MKTPIWCALLGSLTLPLLAGPAAADPPPTDELVIVGAGFAGTWGTILDASNPGPGQLAATLVAPFTFQCPAPAFCEGGASFAMAGFASQEVNAFGLDQPPQVATVYIVPASGSGLPSVRCLVVNDVQPPQSIELPVSRLSTLLAINPTVLSFPALRAGHSGRSNLVLTSLAPADGSSRSTITVRVDAIGVGLSPVGSASYTIGFGQTLFLPDIGGALGAPQPFYGQFLVTKTGGDGYLWGVMSTLDSDGTVAVSQGLNP